MPPRRQGAHYCTRKVQPDISGYGAFEYLISANPTIRGTGRRLDQLGPWRLAATAPIAEPESRRASSSHQAMRYDECGAALHQLADDCITGARSPDQRLAWLVQKST